MNWKKVGLLWLACLLLVQSLQFFIPHHVQAEESGTTLLATESTWKYLDTGTYPGDGWNSANFDDTTWKSGKGAFGYNPKNAQVGINTTLSYGEDAQKKYPVSFFRTQFDTTHADTYKRLSLKLKADDSAVIYLNGQEIKRVRLAEGTINFTDYSGELGPDAAEYESFHIPLADGLLKNGTNTLAVAVFQQKGSSSDLTFDAGLSAYTTDAPEQETNIVPKKIAVTFYGDTFTQKGFSWHTETEARSDLEYVKAVGNTPDFSQAQTVSGQMEANDPAIGGFSHQVAAKYLEPGTTYFYRVGDKSQNVWSEPAKFTTQARGTNSFDFLYVTDSQGSSEEEYTWTDATLNKGFSLYPEAKFILQTGDLVNTSSSKNEWNWLFSTSQNLLSNTTIAAAAGNHDAYNNTFRQHFMLEKQPNANHLNKGVYYSFDYGPAHFMILNTNDQDPRPLDANQLAWLKQDAKAARANGAKWLVVAFHKGIYSVASHMEDAEIKDLRAQLAPTFDELGIDVVLQGHDHVYFRSEQMNGTEKADDSQIQTISENGIETDVDPGGQSYHIINTSGYKFYQPKSADRIAAAKVYPAKYAQPLLQMFAGISFTQDRFTFKAYTYDAKNSGEATPFDSYAILKTDRAKAVEQLIAAIPAKIQLSDEAAILSARKAADQLDSTLRGYVGNLDLLAQHEATLAKLKEEANQPPAPKPVPDVQPTPAPTPQPEKESDHSQQPADASAQPEKSISVTADKADQKMPKTGDQEIPTSILVIGIALLLLGTTLLIVQRRKRKI
ncbi:purple acid phosphatase family protein [Listeria costaricensis]|uniref:purple acid phosphatase family protein n=1 Tax=Listeria costaricensis TaxID=2026604 RepID=UPI000C081E34|nr:metallophosphoesterase family protein [Listeria costaricensis]